VSARGGPTAKVPDWKDIEAVAKWAIGAYNDALDDAEYEHAMQRWDTVPGVPLSTIYAMMERDAVEKAQQGSFKLLAELLRPDHPMNSESMGEATLRASLTPGTWNLIVDRLSGKKSKRGRTGRPRKTGDEKRASSAVHDAAGELAEIKRILERGYVGRKTKDISDRALYVIERLYEIERERLPGELASFLGYPEKNKEVYDRALEDLLRRLDIDQEKLDNYRNRPKDDRRRRL
jgi:hypothetical protein